MQDAGGSAQSNEARLAEFVLEISEDEWYSFGADRTDVQKAARELLADMYGQASNESAR